jgi:hypothetical protein
MAMFYASPDPQGQGHKRVKGIRTGLVFIKLKSNGADSMQRRGDETEILFLCPLAAGKKQP